MLFLGIKPRFMLEQKNQKSYREAIKALEKIEILDTPRDKLACLNECYAAIKSAVVDFHKGKVSGYFNLFFLAGTHRNG